MALDDLRQAISSKEVNSRIELELAYCSEKVLNLDILLMHTTNSLSDCEALSAENNSISSDFTEKAFEFELLSWILECEIQELDTFMASLQRDIENNLQIADAAVTEKLRHAEESLRVSREQVSEIRMQSEKFSRAMDLGGREISKSDGNEDDWQMQTAEQKRQILRMLEKSLARELDLERELSDARNNGGGGLNVHLGEQEEQIQTSLILKPNAMIHGFIASTEEVQAEDEQDIPRMKPTETVNLMGVLEDERDMREKTLIFASRRDVEKLMEDLRKRVYAAEVRAYDAELRCSLLIESNSMLNGEIRFLRRKVQSLERLLRNTDFQTKTTSAKNAGIENRVITYLVAISDDDNTGWTHQGESSLTICHTESMRKLDREKSTERGKKRSKNAFLAILFSAISICGVYFFQLEATSFR